MKPSDIHPGLWLAHVPDIVGKGRPRFSTVNGQARAYTPKATRDAEEAVKAACLATRIRRGGQLRDEGCILAVVVLDPLGPWATTPKGKPSKKGAQAHAQALPAAARPDADNLLKLAGDGAQGAWFTSDSRVTPWLWRGWARSPRHVGMWLGCWEATAPRDVLALLGDAERGPLALARALSGIR